MAFSHLSSKIGFKKLEKKWTMFTDQLCLWFFSVVEKNRENNNGNENAIDVHCNDEINKQCKTGETNIYVVRTQARQILCEKHLVYLEYPLCSEVLSQKTFDKQIIQNNKPVQRNCTMSQDIILLSLVFIHFVCSCSASIMTPFFPREAREKGMGSFLSGCVFSFYALVVLITAPIFGKVLPKVGAKALFVGGMLMTGVSNTLFGLIDNLTDYNCFVLASFVLRGLEALGEAAYSTSTYVYVIELYPDSVSTILGLGETCIGLGLSVGPALGGILYSVGGFGLPFYFLGGVIIATVPISVCILPNIKSIRKDDEEEGSFWKLIQIPSVFIISLVILISSNIWAFLDPTLEPHLEQELNLTSKDVGFVFLLFSSVYAIFSSLCGWLADTFDNHWSLMIIGLVVSAMSLLTLGPSPLMSTNHSTLSINLASLSAISASTALTLTPTFQALFKCAVKSGRNKKALATYGLVAGIWECMYSLGELLGPVIGGIILDVYGFPILTTVMAFITLAMAVVALIFFMCRDICTNYNKESLKPIINEEKCFYCIMEATLMMKSQNIYKE